MADALYRGLSRPDWLRPAVDGVWDGVSLTHAKLLELTRDTKKTLYVVSAAYIGVGFVLAVICLATGQLLGTFLGFLIISGTLGAAAVLRAVLRIGVRVSAITDGLDDIRHRLDRVETALHSLNTPDTGRAQSLPEHHDEPRSPREIRGMLDLARAHGVEPEVITAATLDRGVFPRLVSLLEQESGLDDHNWEKTAQTPSVSPESAAHQDNAASTAIHRNHPEMMNVHDSDRLAESSESDSTIEQSLRRSFADCVKRRDVAGMLQVAEQVIQQLPDHPMANECRRLQPRLREALDGADDEESDHVDASPLPSHSARQVANATP